MSKKKREDLYVDVIDEIVGPHVEKAIARIKKSILEVATDMFSSVVSDVMKVVMEEKDDDEIVMKKSDNDDEGFIMAD